MDGLVTETAFGGGFWFSFIFLNEFYCEASLSVPNRLGKETNLVLLVFLPPFFKTKAHGQPVGAWKQLSFSHLLTHTFWLGWSWGFTEKNHTHTHTRTHKHIHIYISIMAPVPLYDLSKETSSHE